VFASSLNNMALVYKESGQTTKALNYYEEALKVYEETAGADHPSTIAVLANTGLLYARMAETTRGVERLTVLDTAHDYLERALQLRKDVFFQAAPIVSVTMTHLGNVKRLQRAFPAAEALYQSAIERLADKPGTDHRAYGDAQNGYGLLLKDQGKFDEALQAYNVALSVRTAAVGPTHPDVLVTQYNISECLIASGDVQGCVAALKFTMTPHRQFSLLFCRGAALQQEILRSVGVDAEAVTAEEMEGQELPGGLVIRGGQILAPTDAGAEPLPATPAERGADKAAAALGAEKEAGGAVVEDSSTTAAKGVQTRGRVNK
jgi:tetratricopeptide (TPR) repeat protein